MELLWYSFMVVYVLGMLIFLGLSTRTLWCPYCRVQAIAWAHQIDNTAPPIFEVLYCCPRCHTVAWKRFVNAASD